MRLPKEFRFDGHVVRIKRDGRRVNLEPIEDEWAWLKDVVGDLDQDFLDAINEEVPQQKRPELDDLFR